jgi:hypothetical protein
MTRKLAIALTVLMFALFAWGLFLERNAVTITINGQEIGAGGLIVALVALFCAAILLVFVFAGIGVLALGGIVLACLLLVAFNFPFFLPILVPLAILWGFLALTRSH